MGLIYINCTFYFQANLHKFTKPILYGGVRNGYQFCCNFDLSCPSCIHLFEAEVDHNEYPASARFSGYCS